MNEARAAIIVAGVAVIGTVVGAYFQAQSAESTSKDNNKTTLASVKETNKTTLALADKKEFEKYRDRRQVAYLDFLSAANTVGSAQNGEKLEGRLLSARDRVRIIGVRTVREKADALTKVALSGSGVGDPPYERARRQFVDAAAAEVEAYSEEKP